MPRTLQKHMCPRQIRCSWLQCDCTKMLGKRQRPEGLYSSSAPSPIPFLQWQQGLCSDWFETDTRFIECVLKQPLIMPKHIPDTPTVRAIAVYLKFGVITSCPRCSRCSGSVKFESRSSRGWRTYGWTCASAGHKHMETQVNAYPSILRHKRSLSVLGPAALPCACVGAETTRAPLLRVLLGPRGLGPWM